MPQLKKSMTCNINMNLHYLNMQDTTFQATKHMEHKRLKA